MSESGNAAPYGGCGSGLHGPVTHVLIEMHGCGGGGCSPCHPRWGRQPPLIPVTQHVRPAPQSSLVEHVAPAFRFTVAVAVAVALTVAVTVAVAVAVAVALGARGALGSGAVTSGVLDAVGAIVTVVASGLRSHASAHVAIAAA